MKGMLGLWREHFDGLLNGDTNTDEVEPEIPIADDGIDIPSPDYDEVCRKLMACQQSYLRPEALMEIRTPTGEIDIP